MPDGSSEDRGDGEKAQSSHAMLQVAPAFTFAPVKKTYGPALTPLIIYVIFVAVAVCAEEAIPLFCT